MTLRSLLVALLVLAPVALFAKTKQKNVLFVCTGNFYRSRYAEIVFNAAPPKGWAASSRGLDTSHPRKTPMSPLVTAELARLSIAVPPEQARPPAQITQADLDAADVVVLLDGAEHEPMLKQKFPSVPAAKLRSWPVKDAPAMAPADAFAAMSYAVDALRSELQ